MAPISSEDRKVYASYNDASFVTKSFDTRRSSTNSSPSSSALSTAESPPNSSSSSSFAKKVTQMMSVTETPRSYSYYNGDDDDGDDDEQQPTLYISMGEDSQNDVVLSFDGDNDHDNDDDDDVYLDYDPGEAYFDDVIHHHYPAMLDRIDLFAGSESHNKNPKKGVVKESLLGELDICPDLLFAGIAAAAAAAFGLIFMAITAAGGRRRRRRMSEVNNPGFGDYFVLGRMEKKCALLKRELLNAF